MNQGKRMISVLLVVSLVVSMSFSVGATDMKDMKDKQQKLEDQRDKAAAEQDSLEKKVKKLTASMEQTEAELKEKRAEMEATEQELVMAKLEESDQYASMKLRIQYMYENGNVNLIEVFLESESIVEFFNKAEYIKKMSEYDRKKLKEFQRIVVEVEEKEMALQTESDELAALQTSLIAQRDEAEELLKAKSSELAGLRSELQSIRTKIANAEAEAQKKQEADNADKEPSSKPSSGGGSSSQAKPPVVSGNGYFTHPCPGMSYQSSYFGEVRYGIGDTRPHKGHDYAAPKGTPIYAAAAGTVLIAGWSDSAGYWVVINHGNGLTSKYMHMYARPLVSAGQTVSKGQHIGGVGTTGQSTGNHLHFQVEVYGTPVNPSNYM